MLSLERVASLRSCGSCNSAFRGTRPRITITTRPAFVRQTTITHAKSSVAPPATLPVKSLDGSDAGTETLALKVADPSTAKGLVHRYLVYVQTNRRRGTASTLTRSEVRGGGRKPYKQKGTGNARRGSTTSPLMVGGGVTFGPKPKDWSIKMNLKERRLALATALQSAAEDTIVVDSLTGIDQPKTKLVVESMAKIGVDVMARNTLLIVNEYTETLELATRNIEKLSVNTAGAIRVFDVLKAHKIIIEASALESLKAQYSG